MADKRVLSRMKKELERLKNDPPHGVTCWCKQGKLNNLEANLLGAEGTPYEGGVFKLDIEIPTNYPFQPPHVQFLTQIYHPNIDTAGRICLDVLKSPPTGSWKPAHNLHTILTSIQLLLAEPNPDDGLMADISVEYKQRRPTFISKAKEWTCKYAKTGLPPTSGPQDSHDGSIGSDMTPQLLSEPCKDAPEVPGTATAHISKNGTGCETPKLPTIEVDVVKSKGKAFGCSSVQEGKGSAIQPIVIDDKCVTFTKEGKNTVKSGQGSVQDRSNQDGEEKSGLGRKRSGQCQDRQVKRKKKLGGEDDEGHTKEKVVIEL